MIETKILGDAVGVQRQDVIDKSETTPLPSLANGVITGRFKRGRLDKPFKVTASNYKALLGHDPSNPSYLAVEDAFKNGVNELSILRVGQTGSAGVDTGGDAGGGGSAEIDWSALALNSVVEIDVNSDNDAFFEMELNGVIINKGGVDTLIGDYQMGFEDYDFKVIFSSDRPSVLTIKPFDDTVVNVKLTPTESQKDYSTKFITGQGEVQTDGTFAFRLKDEYGFGA